MAVAMLKARGGDGGAIAELSLAACDMHPSTSSCCAPAGSNAVGALHPVYLGLLPQEGG
eukprot:CAMPEP_0179148594 /NCGR_PEP_ID=MMETSP0796-20121207/71924_1 /TAXON_ID=73915 /ORGANISM="Pyrodinium bahamense, Strain pbaha01" /LENGTH=58 /DNA_ID=CAMNT_0020849337 /DNA_START=9 /DNA_END=181 /DNA_ORIENTATION=-